MPVVVIAAVAALALNLYALALIVLRGVIFRTRIYRPMVLNIGLSVLPVIVVLALGARAMYLGRCLRFNSWDVRHPSSMIDKTRSSFSTGTRIADCAAFVLSHTILIGLLYVPLFTGAYRLLLAG